MFITKKHISRRTVLRGAGVALALPLLDSMIPAQTPLAKTAAVPKTRFTGIFVPHGMALASLSGFPGGPRSKPRSPQVHHGAPRSLSRPIRHPQRHVDQVRRATSRVTGADHWVAAAYLCANKPKKTTGADIEDGTTIDQIIAQKIGQDSLLRFFAACDRRPRSQLQQLRRRL